MVCLLKWILNVVLCCLGVSATFYKQEPETRSMFAEKEEHQNRPRRDIVTVESKQLQQNKESAAQSKKSEESIKISKSHVKDGVKRRGPSNVHKKSKGKRRCFLGSPYDCPVGFEDTLLDWKTPWGWRPGPLYPEYGPHFQQSVWARPQQWGNPAGLTGYEHPGCGGGGHARPGPWRPWECCCGCCDCNEGGEEESNDMPQSNDAPDSKPPPAHLPGPPQVLRPFVGKPSHPGGLQGHTDENKKVESGTRRFDVSSPTYPDTEIDPQLFGEPSQVSVGNWKTPDQASTEKVSGNLFLWKWNGGKVHV